MSLDVCGRQYMLHWIIKYSNEVVALSSMVYFFDGLNERETHLQYLIYEGNAGEKARSRTWRSIKN